MHPEIETLYAFPSVTAAAKYMPMARSTKSEGPDRVRRFYGDLKNLEGGDFLTSAVLEDLLNAKPSRVRRIAINKPRMFC
jgi:hypothetical protein